jgi:hypothetical protein
VLATAGVSVTLSSVANAAAFLLGALSPIPAVADFALQVRSTAMKKLQRIVIVATVWHGATENGP